MNNLKQLIRNHLQKVQTMQLATQSVGQPWCCTVHFAADDKLNIYWASTPDRRHSQEIGECAKVAAAMAVESRPGKPVIGIQVEGEAQRIDDLKVVAEALKCYGHHRDDAWRQCLIDGSSKDKLYRLTPRLIQLFDKQNFPQDPKQTWHP